jgi:hypothetical protein
MYIYTYICIYREDAIRRERDDEYDGGLEDANEREQEDLEVFLYAC